MAKYTTELRSILENYAGYDEAKSYANVKDVLSKARTKLFDFDFPIFDEDYRPLLETKIMKHFYMREIGFETVGQFKLFLDTKMNEIMPLYNQYYKSELIKFNPMADFDYTVEGNKNESGNRNRSVEGTSKSDKGTQGKEVRDTASNAHYEENSTASSSGNSWDYYHDTPQGSVSFPIADSAYLSNARKIEAESTDTNNKSGNNENTDNTTITETANETVAGSQNVKDDVKFDSINDYAEHHFGKGMTGSYSDYLLKFRETFMNIDMMVMEDLDELFMRLW